MRNILAQRGRTAPEGQLAKQLYFPVYLTVYIAVRRGMNDQSPTARDRQLAAELAKAKPMRGGSLSDRMVKCSKPVYPSSEDPNARHGPDFSLRIEERFEPGQLAGIFLLRLQTNMKIPIQVACGS
jgi:hypothetical protein